jgi:titin
VYIYDAPNNVIGNVISGNLGDGVVIDNYSAGGTLIQGNYIGTNASGTADLGNTYNGVYIYLASNNVIGGTITGAGNLISGNNHNGIVIDGSDGGATGNLGAGQPHRH